MANAILALISGLLFGIGLAVSQMVNPAKVVGFLDLFGNWDPSLAFVMGGALAVTLPAFHIIVRRRPQPWFAPRFYLPTRQDLDVRLLSGAAIFGVGWGLAGICPGPGITALAAGMTPMVAFVAAMVTGALIHKLLFERGSSAACDAAIAD